MTEQEREILRDAVVCSGWYVTADNIVAVARLMKLGHLKAIDDDEGPRVFATEKGTKAALRLKIVYRRVNDEHGLGEFGYA
jgi:hypothetical protein